MKEEKTDWRKYRKSTHLASADLDAIETQNQTLIFTIKECKYEQDVDVSGTKMDGIFCYFMDDDVKALKLNSTNSKILAGFAKNNDHKGKEAHVIQNWAGLKIELFVDRNVKMMGTTTEGIRIKPLQPKEEKVKPNFTEDNFEKAKKAEATIEAIEKVYLLTDKIKAKYEDYRNNG